MGLSNKSVKNLGNDFKPCKNIHILLYRDRVMFVVCQKKTISNVKWQVRNLHRAFEIVGS